ncbi:hypothetical protein GCM10007392_43750 [Saccharospirillum salsuginis]|uniref:Uncharacterized protein n=1 Tax=Saccharospirillum salsuginis TaxID=418750 RepID=A0A918KPG3_9GAMM|nr:hypothetical protein GCM10007392_43750 [Saccharospirillum salsuginis]
MRTRQLINAVQSLQIVIVVLAITSCGPSGMTAGELYDSCSAIHVPKADRTNEENVEFARCRKLSERVFYNSGYVYVGDEQDPNIRELKNYCPSQWSSQGLESGPYIHLVRYWDERGISFWQRNFVDAEEAIMDTYAKIFPECPQKRSEAGIPKVTSY